MHSLFLERARNLYNLMKLFHSLHNHQAWPALCLNIPMFLYDLLTAVGLSQQEVLSLLGAEAEHYLRAHEVID